ncbi:MAG: GNAT family N-acetyltransferase [Proteobacteria bacterium]|nr:GNAT family N-acetyltransferase [Pseudomonadota bacterium]
MHIRPFTAADAPALANLFRRSVLEIGSRDYTPEQVAAWAGPQSNAESLAARLGDGRLALVATDDAGHVQAFGDLEADGHIDFLYASPEAAGTGIAAAVYEALERAAREKGLSRLYTEASEAARRFFLKRGFAVLSRRAFEVRGVPIHNYAMEKIL